MTDVANNPLTGFLYESKKWLNGFEEKSRIPLQQLRPMYAGISNGFFSFDSLQNTVNALAKPPPPWYFGVKHASKVNVAPGEIRNNQTFFKASMSLNNFVLKTVSLWKRSAENRVMFGHASMFGLEKLLDAEREGASSQPIVVSWEITQIVKVAGRYSVQVAAPPMTLVQPATVPS